MRCVFSSCKDDVFRSRYLFGKVEQCTVPRTTEPDGHPVLRLGYTKTRAGAERPACDGFVEGVPLRHQVKS